MSQAGPCKVPAACQPVAITCRNIIAHQQIAVQARRADTSSAGAVRLRFRHSITEGLKGRHKTSEKMEIALSLCRPSGPVNLRSLFPVQLSGLFDHLLKLLHSCIVAILFRQAGYQMRQCLQVDGFSQRLAS
jgi:hypothetical protein